MTKKLELHLPFPPTINSYYAFSRHGVYIKTPGKRYREAIEREVREQNGRLHLSGRLDVSIMFFAPDNRIRDLDNYVKPMFDALTKAGVWDDDRQIDYFEMQRMYKDDTGSGKIVMHIEWDTPSES